MFGQSMPIMGKDTDDSVRLLEHNEEEEEEGFKHNANWEVFFEPVRPAPPPPSAAPPRPTRAWLRAGRREGGLRAAACGQAAARVR